MRELDISLEETYFIQLFHFIYLHSSKNQWSLEYMREIMQKDDKNEHRKIGFSLLKLLISF